VGCGGLTCHDPSRVFASNEKRRMCPEEGTHPARAAERQASARCGQAAATKDNPVPALRIEITSVQLNGGGAC